ncbi:MAG: NADPH:quinone oxidoreductase [Candidatus Hydrogenedentota bacterium]
MKAVEIHGQFGLDNLRSVERSVPEAGPGQVLVKVHAASLNYRDLLMVNGFYNPRQPLPLIPCSDGAGEIVAVGAGVCRWKTGDRVAGCFAQGWVAGRPTRTKLAATTLGGPLDGMLAEYAVLEEDGVVAIPGHLRFEEAATLPCAGVTAWSALFRHASVQPGETVLLLGTGGVSIFALQFAKLAGANVIITSSSDEKLERAKALGADHGINYKHEEAWGKAAAKIAGREGVDYVIETGGVGTMTQSMRCIRMGGSILLIGVLGGYEAPLNLTPVLMQDVRVQGVIVGPRETFETMNAAIASTKLQPVIDKTFPMSEIRAAFEHMAEGKHFGKIVVRVE